MEKFQIADLLQAYTWLKKVPSGCSGQVDFPTRQVTFQSHLPNRQGPQQVVCQLNKKVGLPRASKV